MHKHKNLAALVILFIILSTIYFVINQSIYDKINLFKLNQFNEENIDLSKTKSSAYLIVFWSASCPTCVDEIPKYNRIYDNFKSKNVAVVYVALAYSPYDRSKLISDKNIRFFSGYDSDFKISNMFGGIRITPTIFLIDNKGKIVNKYLGSIPEYKIRQDINNLI